MPEMGLPHNFSEAIGSTSFLKFDMFQLANVGCLARHVNYHVQILVTSMVPVMVCGLLVVVGFFVKKLRGVCKTVVLVISYAVLPSVSTTVFGAFPCDELDTGESFLIADYSINCNSASYSTFAAFAGLMLVVYPLGIPLMYSWLLVQKKEKIKKEVRVREADEDLIGIEFLFDNYRPECWYFEIVVTVLRLMMTGVLGLIEPGSATQLSCGMMMAIVGMLVSSWYMPFLEKRDNVLSTLSYVQIFFVMLCALVLKSQEFAEGVDKEGLGVVLIIVNAFLLIITVVTVVVNFFGQMEEEYESDNSKLSGTLMNMFKKKDASNPKMVAKATRLKSMGTKMIEEVKRKAKAAGEERRKNAEGKEKEKGESKDNNGKEGGEGKGGRGGGKKKKRARRGSMTVLLDMFK